MLLLERVKGKELLGFQCCGQHLYCVLGRNRLNIFWLGATVYIYDNNLQGVGLCECYVNKEMGMKYSSLDS
jgi:hypothetical protein